MNCPSCHAPVADGEPECSSCGIIVSKFRGRAAGPRTAPTAPLPAVRPGATISPLLLLLILIAGGAAIFAGARWLLKREKAARPQNTLREVQPSSPDFDLAFQLPGRPQGAASNGRELVIANGSDPWGSLRITRDGGRYESKSVPIIESRHQQKMGLNTLTWNGTHYVGYTTASWFGKTGDVFTLHDPKTLQVVGTHPAPPLLGGLAWDGSHYWASTRKNTETSNEEAFFYKIDFEFKVVARSKPPGIGCQGLAWDGERLWYVDVFSDTIKVLSVSKEEPRVIHETETPIDYLSGVVFHQNAVWVMDYGENRLQRLRHSTRLAWAGGAPSPPVAPASLIQPTATHPLLSARRQNRFVDRRANDAEEVEWSIAVRDGGLWLTHSRIWFGPELFVQREQSSTFVTIPVFARYTFTVRKPDGAEDKRRFEARAGDNVLYDVRLADASEAGQYSVSLFIHVQYVDANGTGQILNNSGGFLEVTR